MVKILTELEARELHEVLDECFPYAENEDDGPLMVRISECLGMLARLQKIEVEKVIR